MRRTIIKDVNGRHKACDYLVIPSLSPSFRGASEASEPGIQTPDSELASGFRVRAVGAPRNDKGMSRAAECPHSVIPDAAKAAIRNPDARL
jgi:hypothetical protein